MTPSCRTGEREQAGLLKWSEAMTRLWLEKHTGPVIVHFAQGHPNSLELPGEPVRIKLEKR